VFDAGKDSTKDKGLFLQKDNHRPRVTNLSLVATDPRQQRRHTKITVFGNVMPYRHACLSKLRRNLLPQTSDRRHRRRPTIHALVSVLLGYHSASRLSETTTCFDASGTYYPVKRRHIPEKGNNHFEHLKIRN